MNRFFAFALAILMLAVPIVPCVSAAPAVRAGSEDAVTILLECGRMLDEMTERCSSLVVKGGLDDPYNSARLIVKCKGEPDASGSLGFVSGPNGRWAIQYASPAEAKAAAERLSLDPRVEYAVPDTEYKAEFSASGASPCGLEGFNSWGYGAEHVGMAALYDQLLAMYGSVEAMPEVIVAVCDSGVNVGHEFLAGRTVAGYDFVNNDADPSDGFGHGTFCAGVVADGTLYNVKIMPLKCINDDGYFSTSDVVEAVEYAYLHGCAAANMSLIEYNPYVEELYEDVVNAATNAGMVCCVASGNWSGNASDFVPGKIGRSFTVAAHYADHTMWPLSNVGASVDITAPGVDIMSTTNTGGYDVQSGTSFAAPHAAACCAMIKTLAPGLDADMIMGLLKENAVDEGYTGGGAGRLYVGSIDAFDPPPYSLGDANFDGNVDALDALLILRFSMGLETLSEEALQIGDVDRNGVTDATDALTIMRYALGLIASL